MAKVHQKVSATEFSVETGLTDAQIRQAGQRAIEAGKRFMTNTINEAGVSSGRIDYVIKGPGNMVKQMNFSVSWSELSSGRRTVRLVIGDYLTAKSTVMFIPVTPASAPALGSVQRFAEALRRELSAR